MSFDNFTLFEVFDSCQRSQSKHKKGLERMKELYKEDPTDFYENFLSTIYKILTIGKKEASVERLVDLIVKFIDLTKKENDLRQNVLTELIDLIRAKENSSRFRICEILAKILSLSNEIEIELEKKLKKRLPDLLLDRIVSVRIESITITNKIHKFDKNDAITSQYLRVLTSDPSIEVRNHALRNIKITNETLEYVIHRIKDIDPKIRKNAFIISSNIPLKDLENKHIVFVLTEGLCDRDESVKNECIKMLHNWFKSFDEDFLKWINFMDFRKNGYITELSCYHLLYLKYNRKIMNQSSFPMINCEDNMIQLDSLFIFRVFSFFLFSHSDSISHKFELEDLLPNLVILCRLISENKENEEVLRQLFLMVHSEELFLEKNPLHTFFLGALDNTVPVIYDFCDESGRRNFSFLLRDLIGDFKLHGSLVPICMSLFKKSLSEQPRFISQTFDIISDFHSLSQPVYENLVKEQQQCEALEHTLEEIRSEIKKLRKKKAGSSLLEPYLSKKNELKEKLSQSSELVENLSQGYNQFHFRILSVSYHLLLFCSPYDLKHLRGKKDDSDQKSSEEKIDSLDSMMQTIIFPSISKFCSLDEELSEEAVQICLITLCVVGQFSLLDSTEPVIENISSLCYTTNDIIDWMLKFLHLEDQYKLKSTCVKYLFDIMLVSNSKSDYYNPLIVNTLFECFSNCFSSVSNKKTENSESEDDSESVEHNSHETEEMINICVEGFGKLLVANKLNSNGEIASIKEKLLTKMICLFVAKEVRANQYLNIFFPTFSFSNSQNQILTVKLVVPVMQMLIYSTSQSITQLEKIGKYMMSLCDMNKLCKKDFKTISDIDCVHLFFKSSKTAENQVLSDNPLRFEEFFPQIIESMDSEQRLALELLFSASFQKKSLKKKYNLGDYKFQQLFSKEIKIYLKLLNLFSFKPSKDFQNHLVVSILVCLTEKTQSSKLIDSTTKKLADKLMNALLKLKMVEKKEDKIKSLIFGEFNSKRLLQFFEILNDPSQEKKVERKKKVYKEESDLEDSDVDDEVLEKAKKTKKSSKKEIEEDESTDLDDLLISEDDDESPIPIEYLSKSSKPNVSKNKEISSEDEKSNDDSLLCSEDDSQSISLEDQLTKLNIIVSKKNEIESTVDDKNNQINKPTIQPNNRDGRPIKFLLSTLLPKKPPLKDIPGRTLNKPTASSTNRSSSFVSNPSSQVDPNKKNPLSTRTTSSISSSDKKEVSSNIPKSSVSNKESSVSSSVSSKSTANKSTTQDISSNKSSNINTKTFVVNKNIMPKKPSFDLLKSSSTTTSSNATKTSNVGSTKAKVGVSLFTSNDQSIPSDLKDFSLSKKSVSPISSSTIKTKPSVLSNKSTTRISEDNKKKPSLSSSNSKSETTSEKKTTEKRTSSNSSISKERLSNSGKSDKVEKTSSTKTRPEEKISEEIKKKSSRSEISSEKKTSSTSSNNKDERTSSKTSNTNKIIEKSPEEIKKKNSRGEIATEKKTSSSSISKERLSNSNSSKTDEKSSKQTTVNPKTTSATKTTSSNSTNKSTVSNPLKNTTNEPKPSSSNKNSLTSHPNQSTTKSSQDKNDTSSSTSSVSTSSSSSSKKNVPLKSTKPILPPNKSVVSSKKENSKNSFSNKENEILNLIKYGKTKIIEREISDLLCDSTEDDEDEFITEKEKNIKKKNKDIDLLLAVSSDEE